MKCECGSNMFYKHFRVAGTWRRLVEYTNDRCEACHTDLDDARQDEPKTMRCAECNKRYENPEVKGETK